MRYTTRTNSVSIDTKCYTIERLHYKTLPTTGLFGYGNLYAIQKMQYNTIFIFIKGIDPTTQLFFLSFCLSAHH